VFSKYKIIHMDEFVDSILRDEIVFGITLPHLPKRFLLEEQGVLPEYHSPIEDEYFQMHGKPKKQKKAKKSESESEEESREKSGERSPAGSSPNRSESSSDKAPKPKVKDENSIEYWNELRAKQGLRPLKAPETKEETKEPRSPRDKRHKKKHPSKRYSSSDSGKSDDNGKPKKDENSVEYWNELRAKLGIRPLKNTKPQETSERPKGICPDFCRFINPILDSPKAKKDKRHKEKSKKKDKKRRRDSRDRSDDDKQNAPKDTSSVEYWNELRAKMGIKPLKKN
jgi:pre-mRNA-splicing factor 38A